MRMMWMVIAGLLTGTLSAWGHHSPTMFNLNSIVVIQGTVSRFEWKNPHVYVYIQTTRDGGEGGEWLIETDATPILTRNGWTPDSLTIGELVTVRANPARSAGSSHALLVSIATEDQEILTPRSSGVGTVSRASSLAGVWDAMRGFSVRRINYGALTERGAALQAAFSDKDNPVANCVPHASPTIFLTPYLNQIEITDDTVTIRSELFNVDRVVYTDGRGHPENGERSNQGHSIGRWEGDVLIVDTTHFEDNRVGNRVGVPSGGEKHVVERYSLSPDGSRIVIEFEVEDPQYLAEPLTGSIEWDYAPGLELSRFGCDPESARLYTLQ